MAMQPATKCLDDETLGALAHGRLHGGGLSSAEAHLAQCDACQRALGDIALATSITQGSEVSRRAPDSDAFPVPQSVEVRTGSLIDGRYRVQHLLGRGGMGSVFAATHLGLQQRVAIKVLKLAGAQAAARFAREGRTLAQLNNQHIVRVYDSGELANGQPYIVMEHLDGSDLSQLIGESVLSIRESVSYLRQACVALEAAHALSIVHRDLKPSNLFLVRQTGAPLIKVLDFGISKSLQSDSDVTHAPVTLTGTGDVVGSPRYMSPEQLQGLRELDARTDIWSLGVILYELLAGKPPFPQRDFAGVAIAIATDDPLPVRAARSEVPEQLQAIVMRCLQKDPARRFQSVAALAHALEPYDTLIDRQQLSAAPTARRTRGLVLSGLACVLAIGGVLFVRQKPVENAVSPALESPPTATTAVGGSPSQPSAAGTFSSVAAAGSAAIPPPEVERREPVKTGSNSPARTAVRAKPKPNVPQPSPAPIAPVRAKPGLSATPD